MALQKRLARKKATITEKWFAAAIASYPADTARFLKSQSDPFANPVGQTTLQSLQRLFDLLLGDLDQEQTRTCLDAIIRIRAIQNFTPAQAVRFIFDLKGILRDTLAAESREGAGIDMLRDLEGRIDELGLLAFDVYMQCREKIYELKANDVRNRTFRAFARAGLIKEPEENGSTG